MSCRKFIRFIAGREKSNRPTKRSRFLNCLPAATTNSRASSVRFIPTTCRRSFPSESTAACRNTCAGSARPAAKKKNSNTNRVRDYGHADDFESEHQRAGHVDDREHREKNREQAGYHSGAGGDAQPERRAISQGRGAKERDGEHREIREAVEHVRGVVDELKRFLHSGADLTGEADHQPQCGDEEK